MTRPRSDRLDAYFDCLAANFPPAMQAWLSNSDEEFCAAIEKALEKVIVQLESGAHRIRTMDELGLTWFLLELLASASIPAALESQDNDHASVTVKHPTGKNMLIHGICATHQDYKHHCDNCGRLLTRSSIARSFRSFCLEFFRSPGMYERLRALRDQLNAHRPMAQIGEAMDHATKGAFVTLHKHSTATPVSVAHFGCNMYYPVAMEVQANTVAVPAVNTPLKVDIGIVTIRDDEFRAVLAVFPDKIGTVKGARRSYTLCHVDAGGGERYRIAMLRLIEQGQGEAQDAARDLIEDLCPRLVLIVGIAGGRPSEEITLGDVVVSTRIHDFTVEAREAGKASGYDVTGGPIDKALAARVANLAAREDELGDWTAGLPARPQVSWIKKGELYGPADWRHEVREKLAYHHGPEATPHAPRYAAGPIASSDRLMKDPDLLTAWLQDARSLLAIEMESGGVYRAARERCPMLAIRGISDIVGLKRTDAWTKYACASAAAFTRAFLRTRPIALGAAANGAVTVPYATGKTDAAPARPEQCGGSSSTEEGR